MKNKISYQEKLKGFKPQTLFPLLSHQQQRFIEEIAQQYRFTFQEFRQIVEACRDLSMWQEMPLYQWWEERFKGIKHNKKQFFSAFNEHMHQLRSALKEYPPQGLVKKYPLPRDKVRVVNTPKNIFGECPVQSPKTVCCNLKTIDAVESCPFGCSYCTIQTFYSEHISVDGNLAQKLAQLQLDPERNYHIGTGQSSDSLAFSNRAGILDALSRFAADHPNVILELKTKSDNVQYFLEHTTPPNMFCSWTLNPQIIIDNEEHFTASLDKRLRAARKVADRGVKISFHFHPIVYYKTWKEDYLQLVKKVMELFVPEEILFISFGSVTFIKPVLKKIRKLGLPTKIHQMEFVTDPHGKLTYPDEIKIEKFSTLYQAFQPWHNKVFFYLCMEKASIWERSLGYVYPDNETFERDLFEHSIKKIRS